MKSAQEEESSDRALLKKVISLLMLNARPGQEQEVDFCEKWERLVDRQSTLSTSICIPQSGVEIASIQKFIKQTLNEKIPISEGYIVKEPFIENLSNTILSASYVSSLPEAVNEQNEQKMLRYWENYIIPKMQDYVRGSLKPWEFEDFFEQIRQPLRKGDQAKALEISYIICD